MHDQLRKAGERRREKPFKAAATPGADIVPLEGMKLRLGDHHPAHIEPLTAPTWLARGEARDMLADDPVLGFVVERKAYAIPWWIMKNHHVANLTIGGQPLVVKLCEVCSSSAAFRPLVDGRRLNFMVRGAYKGTFVTMDFETGSIWAPFLGEALLGPLQGVRLERLPVFQSRWDEWAALYPDTSVPDGTGESREGHGSDRRPGSFEAPFGVQKTLRHRDPRLPHNELVLGVECEEHARAYPLRTLEHVAPVMNDSLGTAAIVVFSRPRSWMAVAFSREIERLCLEFAAGDSDDVVDRQTQSHWDMLGRAQRGILAGRSLAFVRSGVEEWNVWSSYHPHTEIFEAA
jgi:Protein of unknown function (DUF3179)